MLAYIYEFLSILFDKLKEGSIRNIILFGSFARGNPRKDSDIDLFIDVHEDDRDIVHQSVQESLNEFEFKAEKSWKLKGITNPIVSIVDNLNAEQWQELKKEIGSYGKVLYGLYVNKRGEKQKLLITYNIRRLQQKKKMEIIRKLQGYKIKKGEKLYEQKGILSRIQAEKISNAIIVDREQYQKVADLLRSRKVPMKVIEIWVE